MSGDYIAPAKSMQNGIVEFFKGRMCDELSNDHLFANLDHTRNLVTEWCTDINQCHPHCSLAGLTPQEYVT
ncbi:integrase core domain-containing protein [Hoeflea alexandrii]|uniref:integrase core domain-containing protein n=1 Tax=Hoeflea alexandrii TaxID=288436 RepID=UPI0022B02E52|nr:transposase [Hoeflea alexandrii]MCZ4287722.1 transposase [Hoeflea alexandrii]